MNKRKQLLLDTALVLFEEYGVANTSIQMILDRSGVSKGTFYKFFGSKDDCILAILEQRMQEDMIIRKDLEARNYASDFDLLVDQIVIPMTVPEKQRVLELFWTGLYSGEFDLQNLTRIQLNWLSGRLTQLYGEELQAYTYEGAIFCLGTIHQISNTWRNFRLEQPNWKNLVPKVLNYVEILLRAMLERHEHMIDPDILALINPLSKQIVLDKDSLVAELQTFSRSINQSQASTKAKELTKGLLSLVRDAELNISILEVVLKAFQIEFESSSYQNEARKIAKECWWYMEQSRPHPK
ncbi:transcriptional regulator, TetR family [Paenibacillus algorifonticola]|uniref:Transcriptional regulator, TetR family n=1 Tax=Paenibacillus algorifonticola TaxID=684063 RepID=A0A1I1YUD2_9BACL|nr:TetR/AcrR family transcriptional regulator [Paenibacillus algorifonticola]SFE23156.1 transcriptional regulator, TetR family [Paenibacillus algorifonticola]